MSRGHNKRSNNEEKQNQGKDPKIGIVQFNAQLSLLNSESVSLPLYLQQLLIVVKYGHLISYVFEQNQLKVRSSSNAYIFMGQIANLCQNFLYLQTNQGAYEKFSYLVVAIYLFIMTLFTAFMYFRFSKQQKKTRSLSVKDFLNNLNVKEKKQLYIQAYVREIVKGGFFVKLMQFCLASIIQSIKCFTENGFYFINILFATLTSLCYLTHLFYNLTVSGETMNIYYNKNKIINLKSVDYWLLFFIFALVLLNESSENSTIVLYLDCLILFLISALNTWNIIKNLGYVNERIVKTNIIILSFMGSFSLIVLLNFIQVQQSTINLPVMSILISLLISKIVIMLYERKIKQYQLYSQIQHPKIVQFIISIQFQSTQIDQSKEVIFLNKLYFMGHRQYCQKPTCYCRISAQEERTFNTIQIDQVKIFNNSLLKFNETKNINSYLLHYLHSLNFIGFTNQALQQTNLVIQFLKVQTHKEYQSNDQESCIDRDLKTIKKTSSSKSESFQRNSSTSSIELVKTHSFQMIRPKFRLNFYQTNRVLILMDMIKTQMNQNFLQNTIRLSDKTLQLATSVELFLQSENGNVKLKNKIVRAFKKKSQFLQTLSRPIGIKSRHLFFLAKSLAGDYKKLENKLLKFYETFPSQKLQSVNAFFQAEIMNNFILANKLANIRTISDEQLLKLQQKLIFNLFSNDVKYLIVKYEQKSEFQITHRSNQIHEFFGYTYENFQKVQNLLQLVPHGIKRGHPSLVQKYFTEGQSKFFRQVNMNLVALENEYLVPVDFFFDVTFSDLNDMSFVSFFMKQSNNNSYLIVNSSQYITALSQNFYSMLDMSCLQNSKQKIKNMKALAYVRDIPIAYVLPEFKTICAKLLQSGNDKLDTFYRRYYNQDIVFLKSDCLYGFNQESSTNLELSGRIKSMWSNRHNLVKYVANFSVYYKDIDEQASFYIFEFQDIKLNKDNMRYTSPPNLVLKPTHDFKTLAIKNIENSVLSEYMDDNQQDQDSLVEQVMMEQKVNQPSRHFQRRGEIKPTYALNPIEKQEEDFIRLKLSVDLQIQSQIENVEFEPGINQTTQPILLTMTNAQHQKFFSVQQPQESSVDCWDGLSRQEQAREKDLSDYVLMQVKFYEAELDENIQYDDSISQVGQASQLKGSKFYRKYELIDSIIKSQKRPNQFRLLLISYIFKYSISVIFLGLIFANVSNDMQRFLQEIDMLQIKFSVLGPVNKFFLTQRSWNGYYIRSVVLKQISFEEAQRLSKFTVYNIESTYQDLKNEFKLQLSNPYFKDFFSNENITVIQFGAKNQTRYQISLREALLEWMYVIYDYTISIDWDSLQLESQINGQPFFDYSIANGIPFEFKFNTLVSQIQKFTLRRCELVSSKWYSTIIPFMVIIFIICLMQYRYYRNFIGHYERILHVFRLMEPSAISKDLLRYGVLSEMLEKNGNLMFMYKFDLAQKENYLKLEDSKKDLSRQKRNFKKEAFNQNIKINQPWILSALVIGIIYLVFFIYSGIVLFLTEQYLGKYKTTTEFYFTLGNAGVAVCGAYTWKELHYEYTNYTYLTKNDAENMIRLFKFNLDIISQSSEQLSLFQSKQDQYLITDEFSRDLIDASTTDFCSQFSEQYQNISGQFCNESKKGLISTLNKMRSDLLQEFLINNFTYRSLENYPFQQLELPMLTYEMIYILIIKFKDGLTQITNQVIQTIVIISIIYLLYATSKITYIFRNVREYYDHEFSLVKRFLLLLPQHTIFLESHFEQAVHLMMVQDSIL